MTRLLLTGRVQLPDGKLLMNLGGKLLRWGEPLDGDGMVLPFLRR